MSDHIEFLRDLRAIEDMDDALEDQALHRASDHEFPGGDALVMLGPSANMTAYQHQVAAALVGSYDGPAGEYDQDSDPAPPLLVLASWEDIIRSERDEPTSLRATIARAADYLRRVAGWAWSESEDGPTFLPADEMATDVRRLRLRMESVLLEGVRPERGVPCMYDECGGARLFRLIDDHGERSDWQCPKCRRTWSEEDYWRNVGAANGRLKTEIIEGVTWATYDHAAREVGRPQATIRKWVHEGSIATACMILGRRMRFVSLDDVRERDTQATRGRGGDRAQRVS